MKIPEKVPEVGFYYHYKHDPEGEVNNYAYEFLSVGLHTEDDARPGEESFVNYRPLYEEALVYQATLKTGVLCVDTRPLQMWMGEVEKDSKTFPRFQKITDPGIISQLEKIRGEMYEENHYFS